MVRLRKANEIQNHVHGVRTADTETTQNTGSEGQKPNKDQMGFGFTTPSSRYHLCRAPLGGGGFSRATWMPAAERMGPKGSPCCDPRVDQMTSRLSRAIVGCLNLYCR